MSQDMMQRPGRGAAASRKTMPAIRSGAGGGNGEDQYGSAVGRHSSDVVKPVHRLRSDTSILTPQQRRYERLWSEGEDLRGRVQEAEARSRDLEEVLRKLASQRSRLLWRVAIQTVRANSLRAKVARPPWTRPEEADLKLKAANRVASELGALLDAEKRVWEAQTMQFDKERIALRELFALEKENLERENFALQHQKDHVEREHQILARKVFELERASHLDASSARQQSMPESNYEIAGRLFELERASNFVQAASSGAQQVMSNGVESDCEAAAPVAGLDSSASTFSHPPELKVPTWMRDHRVQLERIRACAKQVEMRVISWECDKLDMNQLPQCDREEMIYFGQCVLELARLLQVRMSEQAPLVRPQSWLSSFGFCCARRQDNQQVAIGQSFWDPRV